MARQTGIILYLTKGTVALFFATVSKQLHRQAAGMRPLVEQKALRHLV